LELVLRYDIGHWKIVARELQKTTKCSRKYDPKHCRERWNNHVNPSLKKSAWTLREDELILQAFLVHGGKWSTIAATIPERNEHQIKNRVKILLKKSLAQTNVDYISVIEPEPSWFNIAPTESVTKSKECGCLEESIYRSKIEAEYDRNNFPTNWLQTEVS
jgi:hypothetical protein